MRVLVVGYGSIGKRHVGNLLQRDDVEQIFVLTKIDPFLLNFKVPKNVTFIKPSESSTHDLSCLESINFSKSDFAIIANETSKHMDSAISLGKLGINLFIEKPLTHTLNRVMELKKVADEMKIKVMVGYNLRFLEIMTTIKEYLSQGLMGNIYFAKIEVGQYLPSWRNDVDYRSTYSASKSMGGGVSLDLSHEIDYMKYLFGFPLSWKIVKGKVSDLEITSDDIFEGVYRYNTYLCNIHMDYLQQHKRRQCRIVGSKGSLICDFVEKRLELQSIVDTELLIDDPVAFDVDKTYKIELGQFIQAIQRDETPAITLADGIDALKLIEEDNVQE
jgi:predicted dehydrogenase